MTTPLSDEARANTRKALLFLVERSTPAQLAEALGMSPAALERVRSPSRNLGTKIAARVARAAGVNLGDVLTGAWPGDLCPKCGRDGVAQHGGCLVGSGDSSAMTADEVSRDLADQDMTDGSSDMLRAFLARLLGWKNERAVDHALRSIDLAVNHDVALVLCGDGDLVSIARGLRRRALGTVRPFVACPVPRGYMPAWVRPPAKHRTGVAAFEAASGGTLCLRTQILPRDFSTLVAQLRATRDVMLIVCTGPSADVNPLLIRPSPLAVPPLATRGGDEIDRVIAEYAADARAELRAPPGSFTRGDHAWVRERAILLDEIETATLRLVAIRAAGSVNAAAIRLRMPRTSLYSWVDQWYPAHLVEAGLLAAELDKHRAGA